MANTKLTAIILNSEKLDYNEQYRALTIPEGASFTVSVKEYEDEKKRIQDKIKVLNTEKSTVDNDLKMEEEQLYRQATERYNQGGEWQKLETYEGKEVTHAQVSLNENVKAAKKRADTIREKKNKILNSLNQELKKLETDYASVVWTWNLAKKRTSVPNGKNESLSTGPTQENMTLNPHIYGGGFAWIEPFWDKKDSKPTGSIKNGLYIHTTSKNPKVNAVEWYGFKEAGQPVKIEGNVAPGSKVQLHIYTQSMYGKNIGIELKANGEILKASSYAWNVVITGNKDKNAPPPKQVNPTYKTLESEDLFLAEVEVYDCSDQNSIKPPANAVTGYLINDKKGKESNYLNVQKALLNFYIDPAWCMKKKGIITIIATIHYNGVKQEMVKFPLKVSANAAPDIKIPDNGNKPVFVDNVETNFEAFHPCNYEKITAKFDEDSNSKEIVIFNSKDLINTKDNLIFPFVVGNDESKREFEIIVENAKTNECFYDNTKKDHQNHVINTSAIESRIIKGEGKYGSEWRLAEVDKLVSGGEKKTEASGDENDDSKLNASHITNKFTFINGISKISAQKSFKILEKKTPFEFEKIPDQKIRMKIGYDYTFGGTVSPLTGLAYTFWPYSDSTVQRYPVKIETCAYKKNLDIMIYPDTKWTIQLGFNYDKEKFNKVRQEYHQKWKLQTLEAEEEKKRLQAKVDGTEENLKKYAEEKKKAKKKEKGEWQGKIDRQRKKGANLSNRINERQEIINQSGKKTSRRGQLSKAFDLMEPDDALEHGLIDCELGIIAEFDRPHGAIDLTTGYSEIVDFIKKIADIRDKINNIIDGKDNDTNKKSPSEKNEKIKSRKEKLDKKAKSKAPNWSFEFIPPSIALSIGWYAERPKDIDKPVMGTMIEGVIDFNPLFGFELTYDLFQLLYKTHPAVAAVAFVLDSLDTIAGDSFDISLKLVVTTKAYGTLKGTINTAEGSNYKDRLMKDDDDSPAKVGFSIDISIIGELRIKGKPSLLAFSKYEAYANVSASVESGVSMEFSTKVDSELLYVEPEIKFEGLLLKYSLDAGIAYDEEDKESKESTGVHFNQDGEIIVLDKYSWPLKDCRIPILKFS